VNEAVELSHNTVSNSGAGHAKDDAVKLVSFNQLILMFPVIEKGFTMLRAEFDACVRTKKLWGRARQLVRGDADANAAAGLVLNRSHLTYLVRTRMRIQTSKAQLAQIALHYVPMDSPTRGGEDASSIEDMEDMSPTTARDVSKSDVFSQWGAGDSGDAEIKTGSSDDEEGDDDIHLSFVELACSPVFHELVAKQAGRIRSGNVGTGPVGAISVESTYRSIVLAIDQCFSILNDAFGLLDINEKGMLTIGELKEAIGGELALGNELMRLFAGRNLIQRADFIVCFMRWVDVIDEKEFDDSGDGLEDAETLAHSRRVTIDQGGGFGNLVAEVVQRSQPTQASHNLAHRGWLSSTVTEIFAALKSANEAAEKHRSSFGAVSAWVRSASFSISFLYTEWRTQMPVDERWLRQLVELGVDIDDGLEHCFNWIDADGSGQIGYDEFVTMLQMIHFPLPVYKSQALFLQFSHDGHEFSYAEFEANVKRIAARASLITGHDARLDAMDGDADEARWQTTGYVTKNSLVRWVVIPGGRAEYMWNASLLVASVFYTASVPYVWSFVRTQLVRKSVTVPMYFFDAVLWANILRKFFTGYVNHHSVIVTKFDQIRAHYLQSDLFFDIVAANPLDLVVWLVDGGPGTAAWLRLFRILRFWDIWAYLHQSMSNMHSSHIYSELTKLLVLTIVLLHFCACYWHYLTRTEGAGQNYLSHANYTEYGSGVTCGEDNDAERPECALHVNEYMVSLYWVTAGMFAIGAGDLLPQNETEQWFTIFLAVINLSFLAYVLGTMSSLFMSADEELVATRHEMRAVERLISSKKIPPAITEEVRAHFDYKADQTENGVNEDEETEIFRSLSLELQVEVAQHISRAPLQNAVVFHLCGDNFLDMMSTQLHEVTISPGTVLFAVNDICRTLQIIVSGSVDLFTRSVETHGDALDSTVRSGDVIAPIPFFFNVRHTCTGRTAVSQFVRMFVLEREDYKRLIKLYPSEEEVISRNVLDGESDDKKSSSGKSRSSASRSQGSYNSLGSVEMSEMSGGSRRSEGEGSVTGSQSGSQYSGLAFGDEEQLNVITQAIEKARKKRDMERVCAMCTAAAKGSLEELKLLSEGGDISLNQGDYDLRTPFHLAASEGHAHVVHWLLEVGADAHVKDRYDGTPVNDAVRERKDGVLALLREHGSSLDTENAASLLCVSAYNGDNDQLRRLVEARVNPNDTDYDGRTAVHLASSEGHIGCLKYLISQFADLNRIDRWGGTPLTDAIRHKQVEVQQLLRMNGANLPKGDNAAGRLCELASTGEGSELQLLVQNGVDVNIGDYDYRRALHLAACNGHLAILESLIDCPNVDINPVDRLGGTPLEDAIREGQAAAAALLEKHGGVRAGHPSLSERLQMRNEQGKLRMTEKDDRVTTERAQHERESEMNSRMAKAIEDRVRLFRKQQVNNATTAASCDAGLLTTLDAICLFVVTFCLRCGSMRYVSLSIRAASTLRKRSRRPRARLCRKRSLDSASHSRSSSNGATHVIISNAMSFA
jgi:ankyrin repeat protein/Ca2+-binding EF-hand superfamily protein